MAKAKWQSQCFQEDPWENAHICRSQAPGDGGTSHAPSTAFWNEQSNKIHQAIQEFGICISSNSPKSTPHGSQPCQPDLWRHMQIRIKQEVAKGPFHQISPHSNKINLLCLVYARWDPSSAKIKISNKTSWISPWHRQSKKEKETIAGATTPKSKEVHSTT